MHLFTMHKQHYFKQGYTRSGRSQMSGRCNRFAQRHFGRADKSRASLWELLMMMKMASSTSYNNNNDNSQRPLLLPPPLPSLCRHPAPPGPPALLRWGAAITAESCSCLWRGQRYKSTEQNVFHHIICSSRAAKPIFP